MSNDLDVYSHLWDPSSEIAIRGVLRGMYIVLCDSNHCAAMLLDKFRAKEATARERAGYHMNRIIDLLDANKDYNPYVHVTIRKLYDDFFELFSIQEVEDAFYYLKDKGYIDAWHADDKEDKPFSDRLIKIACNTNKVLQDWAPYEKLIYPEEQQRPLPLERETVRLAPLTLNKDALIQTEAELTAIQREKRIEAERIKVKQHNKRAIRVRLPGVLTLEQWIETLDYFKWKCAYCQEREYTVFEHFVPLVHGKGTSQDNCVPSCPNCNSVKQAWNPLADFGPGLAEIKDGIERVKAYLEGLQVGQIAIAMNEADYRKEL